MDRPLQIILVDESAKDRAAIIAQLQRGFFRLDIEPVVTAAEFNAAIASTHPWDLVIAEARLPWGDAVAIVRAVRAAQPRCPIILCTWQEDAALAVQAMKEGATDYLLKTPEQLARLATVVRASVAHARRGLALTKTENRYRKLFDGMLVGLYQAAPTGEIVDANPAMVQIAGYETRESLLQSNLFDLYVDACERRRWIETMERDGIVPGFDMKLRRRDGTIVWAENNARVVRDNDGKALYYEGSLENITERKWTEERLNVLAHYDALTGLPNRLLFNDRLQQATTAALRDEYLVGVVFIDLDRFKYVNDTLGHEAGDVLLKAVAARLTACVREGNTVARLSGDEFGVILTNVTHVEEVTKAAENILASFSQPFYLTSRELFISTSIGITVAPFDDSDAEGLIKNAEVAMYSAKDRGRNNFRYYTVDMTATVSRHLAMEHALRRAVEREEFLLHYQPQVQVDTGEMIGMEALLRWGGSSDLVSPAEFIPLAEETGLILPMGEWALRTACMQNKAWQDAGLPPMRVAVNLSARQFQQPGLLEMIQRVLEDTGLNPHYLELEITESVLMHNTEVTIVTLKELSAMGIHLSIDDFGTGYSSLSYLKRFPIDALKIDQSFVRDITTDPDNAAIATAIIAMAHSLGVKVIAEGVETEAQYRFLREHNSEMVQGYYTGRPITATAFTHLLQHPRVALSS